MPKKFIFFLIIAQGIYTLFNWSVYKIVLIFFPGLLTYKISLLALFIILSSTFLIFSALTQNRDNILLRIGYLTASIWTVLIFYFTLASLIVFSASAFTKINIQNFGIYSVIAAVLFTSYGLINARIIRLTKIQIQLSNLPKFWKNKTAILVSDLHLGQILREGYSRRIVGLINKQTPDIVFIPGDFYDGVHNDFQGAADPFKKITAPLGTYYCSGNHEMYAGYAKCETAIKNAGIKILENSVIEIEGLQIAGIAYEHETMPNFSKTLKNLNLNRSKPSILLKHVPKQLEEAAEAGFNLQLSGHTHYGQIWPGNLITKRYWKGFAYGMKNFKNMQVYVSSGLGTWGPPMRLFSKSEMVKITFI